MNNSLFTFSAVALYLACTILLFVCTKQAKPASKCFSKKIIVTIGLIGLILHSLALYSSMITLTGINLGFYSAMSLVSVFITLIVLTAVWRHPIEIIAIILLPIAATTMLLDYANESNHALDTNYSEALVFHILTSIIAYSLLALAALQAILLAVQNKLLHAHQTDSLIKLLPPLKNMESLLFDVILIGFIALTVSLGSGLIFLENMFAQHLAHKTILSILAWFVFLILLIGHWNLGWRGRIAVRWTLGGFLSLMLAYFGSKFVLEILLT